MRLSNFFLGVLVLVGSQAFAASTSRQLSSSDVTTALGYTPTQPSGTFSVGDLVVSGPSTGQMQDSSGCSASGCTMPSAINFTKATSLTPSPGGALGSGVVNVENGTINIWYPFPTGWGGQATGLCVNVNHTYPFNCQISGSFSAATGAASYTSGDQVGALIEIDGTAATFSSMPGTFTSTTFVPTTALNSTQRANLRVGQAIDSNDGTPYSGIISGWDSGGTFITVQGWYQQGTLTNATPSGTAATVRNPTKVFGMNVVAGLAASSVQTSASGMEIDCNNNTGNTYSPLFNGGRINCLDLINLGAGRSSEAIRIHRSGTGDFYNGITLDTNIANAAINIAPITGNTVPIAFAAQAAGGSLGEALRVWDTNGNIRMRINYADSIDLGRQSGTSSNYTMNFFSSAKGTFDSKIVASGGTGAGDGTLTITGTISVPSVTTGTPVASLCIDASNNIIKKTTTGSCV